MIAGSVLPMSGAVVDSPRQRLAQVLREIAAGAGPFHFALLRDAPVDDRLIDNGDADLLGTRESATTLLKMLLERALAGDIHFRVTANKPEKLQIQIYSTDVAHSATYDIWLDLTQVHDGRSLLTAADVAPVMARLVGIEPLPPCLAGAVYLQHLVAKRKPLTAPHTVERVRAFAGHHCDDAECGVARWFTDVVTTGRIPPWVMEESARQIERLLNIRLIDDAHRVRNRWRPRRRIESNDAVCVLGVDGVGKSTLIDAVVQEGVAASDSLVGKKLYRRSLLYRVATRSARHRDAAAREKIDERAAPLLFLRAVSAFRRTLTWRRLRGAGTLLVDRSPLDFLYVGRKGDAGGFHHAAQRLEAWAPSMPSIQLVAPHSVTSARKPELTEAGHAAYDEAMLLRIAGQSPCDHFVFHNGGRLDDSSQALTTYLQRILKTRGRRAAA